MTSAGSGGRRRRSPAFLIGLTSIALLLFSGFAALGIWQVQRLGWKRDLIARVDARIHAAPVPAPDRAARADEYRRVATSGTFLHDKAALVQASTMLGPGFWLLAPLRRPDGSIVLVNRGFVPDRRTGYDRPAGNVRVTGLLRLSEPGGGFLRDNDPAADRWYSRDVAAIARSRGVKAIPDYFIDAQASPSRQAYPVGGLTVVRFPNNHLQYAITWFAMAAMAVAGYILVLRRTAKDGDR